MSVLALISDLMMQSQVSSAAARAGVSLRLVSSEDALAEQAAQLALAGSTPIDLVVVDLSHPGLDPAGLMERLRPALAPGTPTLAFGPHVHKGRLEAAAAAGFTAVLSRGQFHANMEPLLAGKIGR
jgi:CheY-like chemotaxis protein